MLADSIVAGGERRAIEFSGFGEPALLQRCEKFGVLEGDVPRGDQFADRQGRLDPGAFGDRGDGPAGEIDIGLEDFCAGDGGDTRHAMQRRAGLPGEDIRLGRLFQGDELVGGVLGARIGLEDCRRRPDLGAGQRIHGMGLRQYRARERQRGEQWD